VGVARTGEAENCWVRERALLSKQRRGERHNHDGIDESQESCHRALLLSLKGFSGPGVRMPRRLEFQQPVLGRWWAGGSTRSQAPAAITCELTLSLLRSN